MKSDNINESDNVNEKENITAKSGGCAEYTATLPDDVKSDNTMLEAAAELIKESDEKERNGKSFLICFVCTGNTCRSPMAAAWFNHAEAERFDKAAGGNELKKRKAISAGLSPLPGAPKMLQSRCMTQASNQMKKTPGENTALKKLVPNLCKNAILLSVFREVTLSH